MALTYCPYINIYISNLHGIQTETIHGDKLKYAQNYCTYPRNRNCLNHSIHQMHSCNKFSLISVLPKLERVDREREPPVLVILIILMAIETFVYIHIHLCK